MGLPSARGEARARLAGSVWLRVPLAPGSYSILLRFGAALASWGIHANHVTLMALLSSMLATGAVAWGHPWLAVVLLVASGVLDLIDGGVARAGGHSSKRGALLDSTCDRVADALPFIGLIYVFRHDGAWVTLPALAMVGSALVSYARARAEALELELSLAFPLRAERTLFVLAAIVALVFDPSRVFAGWLLAMLAGVCFACVGWAVARPQARRSSHRSDQPIRTSRAPRQHTPLS